MNLSNCCCSRVVIVVLSSIVVDVGAVVVVIVLLVVAASVTGRNLLDRIGISPVHNSYNTTGFICSGLRKRKCCALIQRNFSISNTAALLIIRSKLKASYNSCGVYISLSVPSFQPKLAK